MSVANFFQSQAGEDKWIFENVLLPSYGKYVDIGSAHPVINSNTFWLDVMGWDGYCFEPDTSWHSEYAQLRSERCKLINSAVGSFSGEIGFEVSPLHELSKINKESENKVQITTLREAVITHGIPSVDVLSIDVEGLEYDVLCGIDWEHTQPIVVIVEYNTLGIISDDALKFFSYICPQSYTHATTTPFNHIFVKSGFLKK